MCTPKVGEDEPNFDNHIFPIGLVQPPLSLLFLVEDHFILGDFKDEGFVSSSFLMHVFLHSILFYSEFLFFFFKD